MAVVMNMQSSDENTLHPFFTRQNGCQIPDDGHNNLNTDETAPATGDGTGEGDETNETSNQSKTKNSTKARKPKQPAPKAQGQKTLAEVLNPPAADVHLRHPTDGEHQESRVSWNDHDTNERRKRRRTNSYKVDDEGTNGSNKIPASIVEGMTAPAEPIPRPPSPQVFITMPAQTNIDAGPSTGPHSLQPPDTPPKRMMKLNAGGKLSSPSKTKKEDGKDAETEPRRRGRPRKAKEPEPPRTRTVIFCYGMGMDMDQQKLVGQKIQRILEGLERVSEPLSAQKKAKATRKAKSAKPTHPFFSGKPEEKSVPKQSMPPRASASTPGKLRSQAMQDRAPETSKELPYAIGSALLKDRLMVKHPGAKEPPWPDRSQTHVRGLGNETPLRIPEPTASKQKHRQSKHLAASDKTMIDVYSDQLRPEHEPEPRSDGYPGPRHDLRLPNQLLISGDEVLSRVSDELKFTRHNDGTMSDRATVAAKAHPSVHKLYEALPKYLSAFDKCTGEVQGWTQKYAPITAQEVLQPSSKMSILRDWLQSLKVNTVEAAPSTQPTPKVTSKPKKKRRRQHDELNDFLVDDDTVIHDMDTIAETMEFDEPLDNSQPRSIVQVSNGSKVSNAVLISGPHGCGKTASAYAVAKELGYQIFEISSAERRSGRDVIDRVGDMTENHIVRHHGIDPGEVSASEDSSHIDAAFQKDLESGRQGKMSAFFKKQSEVKTAIPKVQNFKIKTMEKLQKALKQSTKDQQQSLILLEEVDVLFKEDKEFWTTIFKLLATSKRPFIMTCNDEDLVPLQAMSLHAILRLGPPPTDSAIDLMLLIAAMEGHLLEREAVSSLFESKDHDLRASIMELDFWCQMGVGDPKNGLNWIYQRYPPGSDVDTYGRKLRLMSEGTFQNGMGLIKPADNFDEDTMFLVWREYGVEPTTIMGWTNAANTAMHGVSANAVPLSLRDMAMMADNLSAMDVYTTHETMDASLPEIPVKSRTHYIEGMALLESNERVDFEDMSAKLAVSSALLTCEAYCSSDARAYNLKTSNLLRCVQDAVNDDNYSLTRRDYACFDMISTSSSSTTSNSLEQSVFDGPMQPIATDIAPYVRSIAQYDLSLEEQRNRLGEIMGDGHKTKRARTTRAARSALEGSQRGNTRRERWFTADLNLEAILATGGKDWSKTTADIRDEMTESSEAPASSMGSVVSTQHEH